MVFIFLAASIGYVEEITGWTASDHPYSNAAQRNQKVSSDIYLLESVLICYFDIV